MNNVFFSPKRVDISLIDHFHPKQKSYSKADPKMAKPAGLQNSTFDPKISLLDSQGSRGELCSRGELMLSHSVRGANWSCLNFLALQASSKIFHIMMLQSKAFSSKNSTKLTNMWNNYSKQNKWNLIAFIQNNENKSV